MTPGPQSSANVLSREEGLSVSPSHGANGSCTIVLLPRHATSWAKMLPLYHLLEAQPGWRPVVVLATSAMVSRAEELREQGIRVQIVGPIERQDQGHFPGLEALWRSICNAMPPLARLNRLFQHDRLAHALPLALLRWRITRSWLKRDRDLFCKLLTELGAIALVVPGDRELGPVAPALGAAKDLGITSILAAPGVPSVPSYAATRRGDARFYVDLGRAPPLLNLLAARRFPNQVADTPMGRLLFSPGWLMLALHQEGLLSHNLWCQGSGLVDVVFVDGTRRQRMFEAQGVPSSKFRVIGDFTLDPLYSSRGQAQATRLRVKAHYALAPNEKLAVLAVPIYWEHNLIDRETHFRELDAVFRVLRDAGERPLLSLHPKSRRADYEGLAARYDLPIADEPLVDILPAAELLLCGSSSTIEWAVLCAVPVINVDYTHLKDPVWDGVPGVVKADGAAELVRVLELLNSDPKQYEKLVNAQRSAGSAYALFDGRAGERVVNFFAALVGEQARDTRANADSGESAVRRVLQA